MPRASKNLKIKFNKVFGYYLEVTNSYKNLVPEHYTRKQTLANAERYITPELKELEDIILGAEDKLFALEYDLFSQVRDTVAKEVVRIQRTAKAIAQIDVFACPCLWWRSATSMCAPRSMRRDSLTSRGDVTLW